MVLQSFRRQWGLLDERERITTHDEASLSFSTRALLGPATFPLAAAAAAAAAVGHQREEPPAPVEEGP
jgi:hypothetical protein